MAGIDQHLGLRTGSAAKIVRHPPVGNVRVIKSRLERLVLDQHDLFRRQSRVGAAQRLLHPSMRRRMLCEPG